MNNENEGIKTEDISSIEDDSQPATTTTSPAPSSENGKGAIIQLEEGKSIDDTLISLLKTGLDKGSFDAVLMPVKVPAGDSFTYLLIRDRSVLDTIPASPLPPIMSVQGAKAISSLTRIENGDLTIAAVMRSCETRAAIELSKLRQANLENMVLISIDCPGAIPLSEFIAVPEKSAEVFQKARSDRDDSVMRPICRVCNKSSMIAGDLHIGTLGAETGSFFIIPNSVKGQEVLDGLNLDAQESISGWHLNANEISEEKQKKRIDANKELKETVGGIDNLTDAFSQCINCHNCMRVCPLCYCQQCYFDSDRMKHPPEDYLQRAESKDSLRFPPDTILFHIGRMMHMTLYCVSCGACEDACPMSIPVSQIYGMVAQDTQELFGYVPGKDPQELRPLATFIETELGEVEE